MKPFFHVVIPVHNRREITRRCLRTLKQQTQDNFQVILVDDGSTDGTADMAQEELPGIRILKGDGNLWWTGATNLGISSALDHAAEGDCVLLLNDDLEVPTDFIERFTKAARAYPAHLIQAVELDHARPDTILSGGCVVNWITADFKELHCGRKIHEFPPDHLESVSIQTGRGLLIPIEAFRKVGLYNAEHHPQTGDSEFPVRAARAGYRLVVHYGIPVYSLSDETAKVNTSRKLSFRDLKAFFWNFRSYGDLRGRFWFAIDTARNPVQATVFLVCDLARLCHSFLRRSVLS